MVIMYELINFKITKFQLTKFLKNHLIKIEAHTYKPDKDYVFKYF